MATAELDMEVASLPAEPRDAVVRLLPYQERDVRCMAKFQHRNFSRQTGKSFDISLRAWFGALEGRRDQLILSASQQQSDEVMRKVGLHAQAKQIALREEARPCDEDGMRLTQRVAYLENGRRIITLPANPRTARGFTGDLYLDEFAMHQHDAEIWAAAYPSITRGDGRVCIYSTPKGRKNLFYRLSLSDEFDRMTVTILDAVRDGCPVDPEALRKGCTSEQMWRQEYLCEYLDEVTAFLTYELIGSCERADLSPNLDPAFRPSGPVYVGVDVGRRHDLTVIWIWELLGDVLWTRGVIELRNTPFDVQESEIAAMIVRLNPRRVAMDATGLGMQLAERMQQRFGRTRIEAVTFGPKVKEDLFTRVRAWAEDGRLRIPASPAIREDWHSIESQVTAAGTVRFSADRTAEGHGDRVTAASLGLFACGDRRAEPRVYVI